MIHLIVKICIWTCYPTEDLFNAMSAACENITGAQRKISGQSVSLSNLNHHTIITASVYGTYCLLNKRFKAARSSHYALLAAEDSRFNIILFGELCLKQITSYTLTTIRHKTTTTTTKNRKYKYKMATLPTNMCNVSYSLHLKSV